MTPTQIAEARAMANAATPGPWMEEAGDVVVDGLHYALAMFDLMHGSDARFVAWCREGVPALIEALEAQTKRADNLAADFEAVTQIKRNYAEMKDAAEARVADLTAKLEAMTARKGFPILHGHGATVDWQLVADHAQQADRNHGQSVARLAARGGLSWCELFAVLHNERWQQIDTNEAMIACRALEARYLAALKSGGA